MTTFGGFNFTGFNGVNLKNTAMIRARMDGGFDGTVSMPDGVEGARSWRLPDKSGSFPIMGTFGVQLPAIVGAHYSTIVTVSGIRAEDAVIVQFNGPATGTTYGFEQSTGHIVKQVIPQNGSLKLYFQNLGNSTAYTSMVMSYLAMR